MTIKYVAGPSCVEYLMRRYECDEAQAIASLRSAKGNIFEAGMCLDVRQQIEDYYREDCLTTWAALYGAK